MPLSAQLSAKRQIIFPRRWAKAFREQHEAASMAIKFHLQRFLGSKTQLAQKMAWSQNLQKTGFSQKRNSAFWLVKTTLTTQSLFDENCGLEDLLRSRSWWHLHCQRLHQLPLSIREAPRPKISGLLSGGRHEKHVFILRSKENDQKKDPKMMWTILISWYGSVSKPCTPGEHQNSW